MFDLTRQPIDTAALRARLENPAAGACAVFEGVVRNHHQGRPVASLEYEAAEDLCRSAAEAMLAEALAAHDIHDAIVAHRTGPLEIGEVAVWIGVSSAHRDAAFAASRFLIEHLKAHLPIWKKEHYAEGDAAWIGA